MGDSCELAYIAHMNQCPQNDVLRKGAVRFLESFCLHGGHNAPEHIAVY